MSQPDADEKKLERLIAALQIADQDAATPEDVAAAIEILLGLIVKAKEEADADIGDARRGVFAKFDEVMRFFRANKKKTNTRIAEVEELVDALLRWKAQRDEDTLDEDIEEVREFMEDAADEIAEVRRLVKLIKKKQGPRGKAGRMPRHEWDETRIRFEIAPNEWGEWVELKGDPGEGGGGGFSFFGGMGGVRRLRAGANITISGDEGEPIISSTATGGSTQTLEDPTGAIDDSNQVFGFTEKPFLIVMNYGVYRESAEGWSWNAGTNEATMPAPAGVGGEIYGIMQ